MGSFGANVVPAQVLRRQRGRVSRSQLLAGGASGKQIARALQTGALIHRRRGVYAVGWVDPAPLGVLWEAHLAGGSESILSHWSAAFALGLVPSLAEPLELTVPRRRRTPGLTIHERRVPPSQIIRPDHLPMTCTSRTVIDVALTSTPRQLERMLDQAAYLDRDLSDLDELIACGYPGARKLRAVARTHAPGSTRTASANEEMFLRLVRDAGLPDPQVNRFVYGYLVDFWWPAYDLVVELDDPSHKLDHRHESDRRRDVALLLAGIRIARFTTERVAVEPDVVMRELALLLDPNSRK